MAVGKEIRVKIASVKNTQKITRAMEMVAASKMRRTQERMQATRPYSQKIARIISHLAQANPEYKNAYMLERPVKNIGLIVVSSDRGLCGGLNTNLFRMLLRSLKSWTDAGVGVRLATIGQKGDHSSMLLVVTLWPRHQNLVIRRMLSRLWVFLQSC